MAERAAGTPAVVGSAVCASGAPGLECLDARTARSGARGRNKESPICSPAGTELCAALVGLDVLSCLGEQWPGWLDIAEDSALRRITNGGEPWHIAIKQSRADRRIRRSLTTPVQSTAVCIPKGTRRRWYGRRWSWRDVFCPKRDVPAWPVIDTRH